MAFCITRSDMSAVKMNGADLLVEALKANGVKNVYGLVGIPVTDVSRLMEMVCILSTLSCVQTKWWQSAAETTDFGLF